MAPAVDRGSIEPFFFEAGEVGFFDWQVASCAPGMRDVSYFLCNSLPAELRGAHERELITRYLEGLKAAGVGAPGWNEAWQRYNDSEQRRCPDRRLIS